MVKERRLILEYYDNIIRGEYAENLEMVMDLKNTDNNEDPEHMQ